MDSINLGDRVKHTVSNFEGIVTGIASYVGATERRIEVTAEKTSEGKVVELWFYESMLTKVS